ncbi:glycosyltransferase family 2 protein [Patescibacteria group bacterium]|nr:glycosyltransferase family 2 protein [Patescibacteria group bacterium]
MKQVNLSILIPTFNEKKNIKYALESVRWANEIFIVDSFSTDETLEIAKTYPNIKIFQHPFENYSKQKNWALDNLPFSNDWIFILDADEQITSQLKQEIIEKVSKKNNNIRGYYVNRRFIFLGKWIRHCGWYPSWNIRLFKKGKARYEERTVNEHMIVQGVVGYLKNDMIHENHKDLADWLRKHNRYSTLEAEEFFKTKKTSLKPSFLGEPVERKRAFKEKFWYKIPFRPFVLFIYLYFIKLGFLDGRVGFIFSCLRAIQQFHIDLKIKELKIKKENEKI